MGPSKIEDDRDFHDPPDPVDADDFLGFDTKYSRSVISHYTYVYSQLLYVAPISYRLYDIGYIKTVPWWSFSQDHIRHNRKFFLIFRFSFLDFHLLKTIVQHKI